MQREGVRCVAVAAFLAAMAAALPAAAEAAPGQDVWSAPAGAARVRLIDVSLDVLLAAGSSSEGDAVLQVLQGGAHDPKKRGFTLQSAELSLSGAVDPYFNAEAHIAFFVDAASGDSGVELEEAFFTTQALPFGLQVKGGAFLTEFGRINPTHAHAWQWLDQPVIATRLFGGDGQRAPGLRVGWLTPLPWYSEILLGAQDANGATMPSFIGEPVEEEEEGHDHGHAHAGPIAGRPTVARPVRSAEDLVYLARWVNSWNVTSTLTAQVGASGLVGPNASGPDGDTLIYGGDLTLRWRPAATRRGWPFVLLEGEVMKRRYDADAVFEDLPAPEPDIDLPAARLEDWGYYAQLLYGFTPGWAAGIRYEHATGSGESLGGRENDPFRDDRTRISPLLTFWPSEFSRVRVQYNLDRADFLEDDAHSVWLGVEVLIGSHPAHRF